MNMVFLTYYNIFSFFKKNEKNIKTNDVIG